MSKQFNEILANNNLIKTKFEQLETKLSQLELSHSNSITPSEEKIFFEITDRQSRSCNIILFNIPETPTTHSNIDDKQSI